MHAQVAVRGELEAVIGGYFRRRALDYFEINHAAGSIEQIDETADVHATDRSIDGQLYGRGIDRGTGLIQILERQRLAFRLELGGVFVVRELHGELRTSEVIAEVPLDQ